jgi:L-malate glycosyltransferase
VPLGLDLQPFLAGDAPPLRGELGIDERAIVFGYVGRLVPIKDLGTLVLAFARLLDAMPCAYLLIAGDGPVRPEIEALITQRKLGGGVRLLGWREDLAPLYATIDVCVLSSRNEGTPVAIIEAMAAGRPVVATRVGGVPDVVEEEATGLLAPPGDVEALAAAMQRLAGDAELRRTMGAHARDVAAAWFGYERLVDDIDRLYADALASKRGGGAG